MHELLVQFLQQVAALWTRRWLVVIIAWTLSVAGWVAVHFIPDRYQASARVYVDTQSLLRPLLAGIAVQPNTTEQVSIMASTLISRPNLEKVARMTDMDLKTQNPEQLDAVTSALEKGITLKGAGDNIYTIAYENKNPALAKKVVQSLLTIFVENGLGSNRKNISSSEKFIEDQLKEYETKLNDAEDALKAFKQKNIGVMRGEKGEDYFTGLADTQDKLNQAEMSLHEAENRRDSLKRQLSGDDPTLLADTGTMSTNPELDARIETLKQNLDSLRLKYTDQYPDIVATKRLIAELEATKKKEASMKHTSSGFTQSTFYQQLNVSLAEAEAEVASMQARVGQYQAQMNQLKNSASRIPEVESQYSQLTRDYDVYKKNYEALLARRESAKLSGEMESKADVVDFRVIDPPRVPGAPSYPNRLLLVTLVLLASIGIGAGVAFLLNQFRPTVHHWSDMRALSEVPLLGTVALVMTPEDKIRERRDLMKLVGTVAGLLVIYMGLMAFHVVQTLTA